MRPQPVPGHQRNRIARTKEPAADTPDFFHRPSVFALAEPRQPGLAAAAEPALGRQFCFLRPAVDGVGEETAAKAAALSLGVDFAERKAGLPALRARGANSDDPAQPRASRRQGECEVVMKYRRLPPQRSSTQGRPDFCEVMKAVAQCMVLYEELTGKRRVSVEGDRCRPVERFVG